MLKRFIYPILLLVLHMQHLLMDILTTAKLIGRKVNVKAKMTNLFAFKKE